MLNWLKKTARIFFICYVSLLVYFFYRAYASVDVSLYWFSLSKPPEEVTKIAHVDDTSIIVETAPDNYYYCKVNAPGGCWVLKNYQTDQASVLQCWRGELPESDAVQVESSCARIWHNYGYRQTIYELRYDGNIYVKQRVVITIVGYFLIGFFAGIMTVIFLGLVNMYPPKQTAIVTEDHLSRK